MNADRPLAVGFSGGADSTALLLGLVALAGDQSSRRPLALHFNHRIHPDSDRWQAHCAALCDRLGVPLITGQWRRDPGDDISEGAARAARYRWFGEAVPPDHVLCLAQHRDDQVETVLMSLLEQRGLHRVAGMRPTRSLGFGDRRAVVRPLLGFGRAALRRYLVDLDVQWIEDPANADPGHRRAWFRSVLIPRLREIAPDIERRAQESALGLQRVVRALDARNRRLLAGLTAPGRRRIFCLGDPLRIPALRRLAADDMRSALRTWIHDASLDSPRDRALVTLSESLALRSGDGVDTRHGATCRLSWGQWTIHAYRDLLHLVGPLPRAGADSEVVPGDQWITGGLAVSWPGGVPAGSPGCGRPETLSWRWRRGGETVLLPGRGHGTTLKKACQQAGIPAWERDALPCLCDGDEVIWIHGIGWCGGMSIGNPGGTVAHPEPVFHWHPARSTLAFTGK